MIGLAWSAVWAAVKAWSTRLLKWFVKPPGSYVALGAAAALALWGFGQHEFSAGRAACETAHQAAAAKAATAQDRHNAAVVAASETRTVAAAKIVTRNQEIVRYVVKTVYARPDAGAECVPAAVADQLRDLQ